ncbi:MAG: phage tail assembly chaperone [Parvibaculum sp.]
MKRFPWARAMEIGLGALRLPPPDFWAMTLPELSAAATGAGFGASVDAMTRERLSALSAQFPDQCENEES